MIKLKYVLVFIKIEDEILLLNREKPTWMGCWNGVGGKIEDKESPTEAAIRETYEETGIKINNPILLAKVGWILDEKKESLGGMYCYIVNVSKEQKIKTPLSTREGIVDFKKITWIMDDNNSGVAKNIKTFLPTMLNGVYQEYMTYYTKRFDELVKVEITNVNNW